MATLSNAVLSRVLLSVSFNELKGKWFWPMTCFEGIFINKNFKCNLQAFEKNIFVDLRLYFFETFAVYRDT